MTVKTDLLIELGRSEDPRLRITEEFVTPRLAGRDVLAVLTRPRNAGRDIGWIVCQSVGQERRHLRRLESLVARELAAAGFPSLRLRAPMDDGARPRSEADMAAQIACATDAVDFLASAIGVTEIGTAGALLGGTVAALVADSLALPYVALWEPVTRGRRYLRESLRLQRISELVGMTGGDASAAQALEELQARGWTTIRGFRMTKRAYDEINAVDLISDIKTFGGTALLTGISASGQPSAGIEQLSERLRQLGGNPTLVNLSAELPMPFGEYYYRDVGLIRADTRVELDREIARATVDWTRQNAECSHEFPEAV